MSAVVIQEMVAGAGGKSEVRFWEAARTAYEREERLLVPTGEDWFLAGKVLYSLIQGVRSRTGQARKMKPEEKQRIIRDVLIARTAKRAGALVVTDNTGDFQKIKRFCNVRQVNGKDYFGQ